TVAMTRRPPFSRRATSLRMTRSPSLSSWPPMMIRGPGSAMWRLHHQTFGRAVGVGCRAEVEHLAPDSLDPGGGQHHQVAGPRHAQAGLHRFFFPENAGDADRIAAGRRRTFGHQADHL